MQTELRLIDHALAVLATPRGVIRLFGQRGLVYALDCPYRNGEDDCGARITVEIDPGHHCARPCEDQGDAYVIGADGCAHCEDGFPDGGAAILRAVADYEEARR